MFQFTSAIIMELLVIMLSVTTCFAINTNLSYPESEQPENFELPPSNLSGDPNKDMYVIHATVYQVGIITNKTDDDSNRTEAMGNEEAVTFYHTNGSHVDLSQLPTPLLTNVTAQRLVGVAPAPVNPNTMSWTDLKQMAAEQNDQKNSADRSSRDVYGEDYAEKSNDEEYLSGEDIPFLERLYKRSSGKKNDKEEKSAVKIASGAAVIPQEAGVNSIAIPPLLTLNNNFSEIPVPIPNTSIVHYAKINTLINQTP